MLKTPDSANSMVLAFCNTIAPSATPIFLPITRSVESKHGDCFHNVMRAVQMRGGRIQYGWAIWEWTGTFFEAEHHAVHDPENGPPWVDVTPGDPGEYRRLFLPDNKATYDFANSRTRHRNIRKAIGVDPLIEEFIAIAAERETVLSEINGLGKVVVVGDLAERIESVQSRFAEVYSRLAVKYSGPHDPCFCGSGRKFKHCHGARNRAE